jgi:short-subunit dehydrogenase
LTAVLITGATGGIGAATARSFAAAGFDLLLVSRSLSRLETLAEELRSTGRRVETCGLDLTDAPAVAPAIDALCRRGISPEVVINNAGAAWTGPLATMPLDQWQWILQLNLTSVFQICQAVLPLLRAAGGGHFINVSSHAAHNAFPEWGAYCVSKAGLASFSRCLAAEERSHGIRVSTLTLGAVNTPLWDSETVHSSFDRRAMLSPGQVADALLHMARQSADQTIEDLTLMPAAGAL